MPRRVLPLAAGHRSRAATGAAAGWRGWRSRTMQRRGGGRRGGDRGARRGRLKMPCRPQPSSPRACVQGRGRWRTHARTPRRVPPVTCPRATRTPSHHMLIAPRAARRRSLGSLGGMRGGLSATRPHAPSLRPPVRRYAVVHLSAQGPACTSTSTSTSVALRTAGTAGSRGVCGARRGGAADAAELQAAGLRGAGCGVTTCGIWSCDLARTCDCLSLNRHRLH